MKLYIIGNGFDMHHNLNTSYVSFGLFLKENYNDVYELLLEHCGFTALNASRVDSEKYKFWAEFETNLSLLDTQTILELHTDSLPNYNSDDFRDRDRYTFQIYMEAILNKLTADLYKGFKEFILSVKYPTPKPNSIISLDKNSLFFTFNYTDTLSKYYDIPDDKVLHIHHKARSDGIKLILGHGIDPENFKEEPELPPKGLSEEDQERWMEYMSEKYDYSYDLGKEMIMRYFTNTFKYTTDIIKNNSEFFKKIICIDDVIILGHSLSPVDIPYFEVIKKSIQADSNWTVTYHSTEDKIKHANALKELGVQNFKQVKILEI